MKKAGLLIYRPMNFFSILRNLVLRDFHPTGRWQPLRALHQSPKMSIDFWELCTTRIQRCRLSSSYQLLPRQDLSSRHEAARLVGSGCTRFFFYCPSPFWLPKITFDFSHEIPHPIFISALNLGGNTLYLDLSWFELFFHLDYLKYLTWFGRNFSHLFY